MEKRVLLFFGITFLIVALWMNIFPPRTPEAPPPEATEVVEETDEARATTSVEADQEAASAPAAQPEETPEGDENAKVAIARAAAAERKLDVETSLYRVEMTNRGARIVSFQLKEHEDADGKPYEMVSQSAAEHLNIRPMDLSLEKEADTEAVRNALFETALRAESISVADGEEETIVLTWADGRGLEVEKRLTFVGGTYRIGVEVSVRRGGEEIEKGVVYAGNPVRAVRYGSEEKGVVSSRGEVTLFKADDIEEEGGALGGVAVESTGVSAHYFAGLMVPTGDEPYGARLEVFRVRTGESETPDRIIAAYLEGARTPTTFTLYLGPKKLERLEALAPGLGHIIELWSWMRYPALLLRKGLVGIYGVVGNYGWSIVLLTIAISVVLLPLKHYSFVSMRRMQKLSPQIQKIRERYKKVKPTDPRYQHMNQEIMALYKEHNVNPVSGCLPMLLMIPFFIAFYQLLMASIELRHAPFVGWIHDLSAYDPLYVLPILMGATQLAIQRMTPQTTADPMQAKIMAFMPIMFTFILARAPSGLVLYWFSNNLVSMAQQLATNRFLTEKEEKETEEEKAVKSVKKGKGSKGHKRKKTHKSVTS